MMGFKPSAAGSAIGPADENSPAAMAPHIRDVRRQYRVDRRQIAFFRFLLEAYDGLAVLRTLDPVEGRIVLYLSASRQGELDEFLCTLADDIRLEPIETAGSGAADPAVLYE